MSHVPSGADEESEPSPNSLALKYGEMAGDVDREREAIEWSGGLIGDQSTQT
jgi:hypothetical protein